MTVEKVVERLNKLTKGWGAFYSVGYPSKAFNAVNGYALRRMARFLNRKSQRHYRLKFADTYYGVKLRGTVPGGSGVLARKRNDFERKMK